MLDSLIRYGYVVVLLALMAEELGIPMLIPTDILIVFVGTGWTCRCRCSCCCSSR